MEIKNFTCCICGEKSQGWGNNPAPLPTKSEDDVCCGVCNVMYVIPARLTMVMSSDKPNTI